MTVHVPVGVLARLGGADFTWQVPALREELITELIRSLPKDLRRNFVPAPDTAKALVSRIQPQGEALLEALQRELRRISGVLVPIDAFDLSRLPAHLRVTFAVTAADGTEVGRGKDLEALQQQFARTAGQAVSEAVGAELNRSGLTDWPTDLEDLPKLVERSVSSTAGDHVVRGYPALVDVGNGVDIRVFPTQVEQSAAMLPGLCRLLRMSIPSPVKAVERSLNPRGRLVLGTNPDGSLSALLEDCADAAVNALVLKPVWTRADFIALREQVTAKLVATTQTVLARVQKVLVAWHDVRLVLEGDPSPTQVDAIADMRSQLDRLTPTGFVTAAGAAHLTDLTRYLTAINRRIERLPQTLTADRERMQRVHAVEDAYDELVQALSPIRAAAPNVRDIAWMIEELRVSLWAQQLGTARPVSEQRIYRAIDAISS